MKKPILISCLLLIAAITINAQDQTAKSSAAERLATAIDEHGLDTALKMFAELRENPGGYDFNEQEFNALGNELLDGQEYEAAVAVFSLNVEVLGVLGGCRGLAVLRSQAVEAQAGQGPGGVREQVWDAHRALG